MVVSVDLCQQILKFRLGFNLPPNRARPEYKLVTPDRHHQPHRGRIFVMIRENRSRRVGQTTHRQERDLRHNRVFRHESPGRHLMFAKKNRSARADCEHAHMVTVRNSGIERSICEECGHVSFRAHETLSAADRKQFERENARRPRQSVS